MTNDDQAQKPSDDNIQDQDINEPDINDLMDEDTPEDVLTLFDKLIPKLNFSFKVSFVRQ